MIAGSIPVVVTRNHKQGEKEMYICDNCHSVSVSGESEKRMIVETRNVSYPPRYKDKMMIDKGGEGSETVRTKTYCSKCFNNQ